MVPVLVCKLILEAVQRCTASFFVLGRSRK
nr:MAG TPA: hypothetical protein [Caudoviricetes sp.]